MNLVNRQPEKGTTMETIGSRAKRIEGLRHSGF